MSHKNAKLLVCGLILILSLSACSQKKSFPTGTFTEDTRNWELILADDGSYQFLSGGTATSTGTYSIQDDELTWETDSYCDIFKAGKATYTWTYKNNTLSLKVKGVDKCTQRYSVLENAPYHKKP